MESEKALWRGPKDVLLARNLYTYEPKDPKTKAKYKVVRARQYMPERSHQRCLHTALICRLIVMNMLGFVRANFAAWP